MTKPLRLSATGGAIATYIEDVFSTYLYTGNGSTQSVVNGIDLSTKGGLVWMKDRVNAATYHFLTDSAIGITNYINSNASNGSFSYSNRVTSLNANGFSLGNEPSTNTNTYSYTSWTFRKQPKFFDVVTYTGNGTTQNISHSLGSAPGCIIVKNVTSGTANWTVYHQSLGADYQLRLNLTNASNYSAGATWGNNTVSVTPTSTQFTVGSNFTVNESGSTHVAYLFAHNAGGFGLTGNDNVISCGSFVTNGSGGASVTLGYEPQWILYRRSDAVDNWKITDTMRGWSMTNGLALYPNLTDAEYNWGGAFWRPTATGVDLVNGATGVGENWIYIAIRRGPMKVPTVGTTVFSPMVSSATTGTKITTNFPIDTQIVDYRVSPQGVTLDRLRGVSTNSTASGQYLKTTTTAAETTVATASLGWDNTGFQINAGWSGADTVYYNFQRAPGFFDEVCYTGTGSATTQSHNLGVIPELLIVKCRSNTTDGSSFNADWWVAVKKSNGYSEWPVLNTTAASVGTDVWSSYFNSATTFIPNNVSVRSGVGGPAGNISGQTYVAYLFATCPGVSKVGSYTGTGATQTINCGFTAGARFVLIKRTDSTGDWYVWDTARGIISGNDPYLLINSNAAEVTSTDYIAPQSSGFGLTATAPAALNASGGTYIFLAIA
jgi:hypothetical protein